MSQTLLVLAAFVIALFIGIYIGKLLFSANAKSEQAALEEKNNGLSFQMEQLNTQYLL